MYVDIDAFIFRQWWCTVIRALPTRATIRSFDWSPVSRLAVYFISASLCVELAAGTSVVRAVFDYTTHMYTYHLSVVVF
jgi:hypothetical protein